MKYTHTHSHTQRYIESHIYIYIYAYTHTYTHKHQHFPPKKVEEVFLKQRCFAFAYGFAVRIAPKTSRDKHQTIPNDISRKKIRWSWKEIPFTTSGRGCTAAKRNAGKSGKAHGFCTPEVITSSLVLLGVRWAGRDRMTESTFYASGIVRKGRNVRDGRGRILMDFS